MTGNAQWLARARAVIPGAVNSPVRAFGAVGGEPRFMVRGKGPWIEDVDGRRYVDLVGSWGPMILGHCHPAVVAAVRDVAERGMSFGAPGPGEVELAEAIVARVPPVQQLRLVSSGTEATMSAIRVARGFTGRSLVVKFAGCYHGHVDALLAQAGSGVATFALPESAGVPTSSTQDVIVLPYNDIDAVRATFDAHSDAIAAVIVEATPANMGVVPPVAGFHREVATIAHAHGALFISDEVLTGFRVAPGGGYELDVVAAGLKAHEIPPWAPDLLTFGKVIGGGLPVGAFGGRADVMGMLAPNGPVYQAGTLSGNPVATAAGLATLAELDAPAYDRLAFAADRVQGAVHDALTGAGVAHRIQRVGSLFSVFFLDEDVRDYDDARRQDTAAFAAFFHSMLDDGVYLPPSAFEAWFVSAAHDDEAIEHIAAALPKAARAAAAAG